MKKLFLLTITSVALMLTTMVATASVSSGFKTGAGQTDTTLSLSKDSTLSCPSQTMTAALQDSFYAGSVTVTVLSIDKDWNWKSVYSHTFSPTSDRNVHNVVFTPFLVDASCMYKVNVTVSADYKNITKASTTAVGSITINNPYNKPLNNN